MHVASEMEDYKQLFQSINKLQPSRLGYIELLQEEVKRNQDVSDVRTKQEIFTNVMEWMLCLCLDLFLDFMPLCKISVEVTNSLR